MAIFSSLQFKKGEAMPIITMDGPPIKDLNKKREMVGAMTDLAAKFYSLPPETIVIVIKENSPENVSVGGELVIDRHSS
jgi:4-oxalocrotonate tautomerase